MPTLHAAAPLRFNGGEREYTKIRNALRVGAEGNRALVVWFKAHDKTILSSIQAVLALQKTGGRKVAKRRVLGTYPAAGFRGETFAYDFVKRGATEDSPETVVLLRIELFPGAGEATLGDIFNRAGLPVTIGTVLNANAFELIDLRWAEKVAAALSAQEPGLAKAIKQHATQWRVTAGFGPNAKTYVPNLKEYSLDRGLVGYVQYSIDPGTRQIALNFPSSPVNYLGPSTDRLRYHVQEGSVAIIQSDRHGAGIGELLTVLKDTAPLASKLVGYYMPAWKRAFDAGLMGTTVQGEVEGQGTYRLRLDGFAEIVVTPVSQYAYNEVVQAFSKNPTFNVGAALSTGDPRTVNASKTRVSVKTTDYYGYKRTRTVDGIRLTFYPEYARVLAAQAPYAVKDLFEAAAQALMPHDKGELEGSFEWMQSECDPMVKMSIAATRDDLVHQAQRDAYEEAARAARLRMDHDRAPFEYQLIGMAFARLRGFRALIGDDMGVGKTLQAIGIMAMLPQARPVVIIAPSAVAFNWRREIAQALPEFRMPGFDVERIERSDDSIGFSKNIVILEGGQDHGKIRAGEPNVYIVSWDSIHSYVEDFLRIGTRLLIGDEADAAKNPEGRRATNLFRLADRIPYVILLTGTPAPNRPDEVWALLRALSRQQWGSFNQFVNRYLKGIDVDSIRWDDPNDPTVLKLEGFNQDVRCYMTRRTKKQVFEGQLPPKTRRSLYVRLRKQSMDTYLRAKDDFKPFYVKQGRERVIQEFIDKGLDPADHQDQINRLVATRYEDVSPKALAAVRTNTLKALVAEMKVPVAVQVIERFVREGRPVVVFATQLRQGVLAIAKGLERRGIPYEMITGEKSTKKKQKSVNAFNDGKVPVMLATSAAKAGVNLQKRCRDMIFLDRWWVPGWESQAEDRIYRYGQKKPVTIWYLHAVETVDGRVEKRIEAKREVIEVAMEAKDIRGLIGGMATDVKEDDVLDDMDLNDRIDDDAYTGPADVVEGEDFDIREVERIQNPSRIHTRRNGVSPLRRGVQHGNKIPNGMTVQSLLFDKAKWTKAQAVSWAVAHNYIVQQVDRPAQYVRVRVKDPATFQRGSFRTIVFSSDRGIKAIVALPKAPGGRKKPLSAQRARKLRQKAAETERAKRRR